MKTYKKVFLLLSLAIISISAMAEIKISDITNKGKEAICKIGARRTSDQYQLLNIPNELEGLQAVSIPRGSFDKAGTDFSFKVSVPVTIYLFVDKRYKKVTLEGWEKTKMTAGWLDKKHGDVIYKKNFPAGIVEIPANPMGVLPHLAVVKEK